MPQSGEEPKFTPAVEMFSASVSLAILRLRMRLLLPRSSGSHGVCPEYVLNMKRHRRARGYADRHRNSSPSRRGAPSSSLATGENTKSKR